MNIERCASNAGLAFFTVLAALQLTDGANLANQLQTALIAAAIQAGLAFFVEWNKETGDYPRITSKLGAALVF